MQKLINSLLLSLGLVVATYPARAFENDFDINDINLDEENFLDINASENLDYHMSTLQIYGTAYHPFNEHMAWDLGLYAGQVEEEQVYLQNNSKNTLNDGVQAKFRMGFEYSSSDKRNLLQINISLNLNDPFNDPGDGGGLSFQTVF